MFIIFFFWLVDKKRFFLLDNISIKVYLIEGKDINLRIDELFCERFLKEGKEGMKRYRNFVIGRDKIN